MFACSDNYDRSDEKTGQNTRIHVKKCDMREDIKELVLKFALESMDNDMKEYEIAHKIKYELDRSYGYAWQVIIGRNFGMQIGHLPGYFISFYIDKLAFAVFKTNP